MKKQQTNKKKLRRSARQAEKENPKQEGKKRSLIMPAAGLGIAAAIGIGIISMVNGVADDLVSEVTVEREATSIDISNVEKKAAPPVEREITRLSIDNVVELDGVSEIYSSKGEFPEVIYVAFSYPSRYELAITEGADTRASVENICFQAYDKHGISSLILAGLKEEHVAKYMRGEKLELKKGKLRESSKLLTLSLLKILNNREWNLYEGDSAEIYRKLKEEELPIELVYEAFREELQNTYSEIYFKTGTWKGNDFTPPPDEVIAERTKDIIGFLVSECNGSIDVILTPEKVKIMCDLIAQKKARYKRKILDCHRDGETPVIVVVGETNCITLPDEVGLDYVTIRPIGHQNIPMPTKEYYEANVFKIFKKTYKVPDALNIQYKVPIVNVELF
jgi:hypothetical protein